MTSWLPCFPGIYVGLRHPDTGPFAWDIGVLITEASLQPIALYCSILGNTVKSDLEPESQGRVPIVVVMDRLDQLAMG